jgi:nucleotide-binding universal stress UspA family protein
VNNVDKAHRLLKENRSHKEKTMFTHILIPTDGSECSQVAVRKGIELAKLTTGSITFLHVIDISIERMISTWALPVIADEMAVLEREGSKALAWALELARGAGVEAATKILRGHPAPAIVEIGKEHDLIIMGTHGLRGLERMFLGSVADGVLHQSQTPILVLRASASESEQAQAAVVPETKSQRSDP